MPSSSTSRSLTKLEAIVHGDDEDGRAGARPARARAVGDWRCDHPRRREVDLIGLVVSLAVCFAAAAVGGVATAGGLRAWYPGLRKPSWTPPNRIFGPVWTVLYAAMAVAAWLVWSARDRVDVGPSLALFAVQLVLNVGWSLVFFGARSPRGGVIVIAALWVAVAATLVAFWRIDLLAGALFVPYLAWVGFAGALNVAIARLARRVALP